MMENSRKRSRKSKLELREGVELEDNSFVYTQIKDQDDKENASSISADPVVKQEKSSDTEIEDKGDASPPISHNPLMKFSVKVEVEECDAAASDSHAARNMSVNNKTVSNKMLDDMTTDVQTVDASTSSVFVPTVGNKQNNSEISIKDKIQDKLKACLNDANRQDKKSEKDDIKQIKEYTTYKPMILRIANSLLKSNNFADKALMIEALNYVGRVPDEPKGIYFQKVLQEWNEWCQLHSAVRDSPLLYKCYVCGSSFWHLYDFREHVPTHNHMKNVDQYQLTIETENDECFLVYYKDLLLKKAFEYPAGKCFKCHKTAENHTFATNVKNYRCIPCKVTFSTCSQLYVHEMKCLAYKNEFVPDDETIQECRICQAGFYTDLKLAEHLCTHHVVRSDVVTTWESMVCFLCNRQFILLTLHTCIKKTNNYGCNYCGRSFQKKIYKELHVKNYHKSFQCRICEKKLMAVCMEPSHFLQHTERFALMYKCIECIVGRYFPDEYSIAQHTETVHNRKFEKKFKYLEMVILPKQCLDVVRKDLSGFATENKKQQAPMKVTSGPKSLSGSQELSKAVPKPIPEPMYSINVVIKDEPVDDNIVAAVRVEPVEIKKETDAASCIQISDVTSLNDLLKLNDKPQEEGPSEDVVIVESKKEVVSLSSSENSDSDDESRKSRKKFTGPKRKRLAKYSCTCGYVAVQRKMKSHKQQCIAVLAMKRLRDSRKRATAGSSGKNTNTNAEVESNTVSLRARSQRRLRPPKSTTASDSQEDEFNSDGDEYQPMPKRGRPSANTVYSCECGFRADYTHMKLHQLDCDDHYTSVKTGKKNKSVKCTKCSTTFENMYKYAAHFGKVHGYEKLTCPSCRQRFGTLAALASDLVRHARHQFVRLTTLNMSLDGAKCTVCSACQRRCQPDDKFAHWESHLELSQPDGKTADDKGEDSEESAPDNQQGRLFSEEDLEEALAALRSTPASLASRQEARQCVLCGRQFARVNDCKRHLVEHLLADAFSRKRPDEGLRCQLCSKLLPKADSYKCHMREHGSMPLYKCEVCSKSFSDSSNFCKHKKVHNLATLSCEICDKKFHNTMCHQRHMEMHNHTKPKFCQLCTRVFYTESAYRRHVLSHEKKVRFRCPICRQTFTRLKDKWDHMWMVHEERQFKADCPLCDHSFRRFADVKSHVRAAHNRSVQRAADGTVVLTCFSCDPRSCDCCPPRTCRTRRTRRTPALGVRGLSDSDSEHDEPQRAPPSDNRPAVVGGSDVIVLEDAIASIARPEHEDPNPGCSFVVVEESNQSSQETAVAGDVEQLCKTETESDANSCHTRGPFRAYVNEFKDFVKQFGAR